MRDQPAVDTDMVARWERAIELAAYARAEWEAQDSPLLVEWSNGTISEHPLLRLVRDAENDAARLARDVAKPGRRTGRPPTATPTSITESPAAIRRREVAARRGS